MLECGGDDVRQAHVHFGRDVDRVRLIAHCHQVALHRHLEGEGLRQPPKMLRQPAYNGREPVTGSGEGQQVIDDRKALDVRQCRQLVEPCVIGEFPSLFFKLDGGTVKGYKLAADVVIEVSTVAEIPAHAARYELLKVAAAIALGWHFRLPF